MNPKQAKKLGAYLRKHREGKDLSVRDLEALSGVDFTTIHRFETGAFAAPAPDKLAQVTKALGLALSDVYALAGYSVPTDLPSPSLYLRTKYRDMPSRQLEALTKELNVIFRRHGVDPSAANTEDETGESPRRAKGRTTPTKKGGKR